MSNEIKVVFISIPREEASRFARDIVEQRLAACVNIIPRMESCYRWEGKVLTDSEALLIVKTSQQVLDKLREYVTTEHPYELPEIIVLSVTDGLSDYLKWVSSETE